MIVLLLLAAAVGRSPRLLDVVPPGGERGSELVVTLQGQRLADTADLLFYEPGIELIQFESVSEKEVHARLRILPDCTLGEHALRLRTRGGITELRTFWVGPFPILAETEPNNSLESAQSLPWPAVAESATSSGGVTVHGVITNEDVDYFRLQARAGQRIAVEVEAMRLGRAMLDASVSILDARRFELASCDDCTLLLQDPSLSTVAPEDGVYWIALRHASYEGGRDHRYRLHVGDFCRPTVVYPPSAPPGQAREFEFLGDVGGPFRQTLDPGKFATARRGLFPTDGDRLSPPSPVWVRAHGVAGVDEQEPNDSFEEAGVVAGDVPVAFQGRIQNPGDRDVFRITLKKGQQLFLRSFARDLRSPVDLVMHLYSAADRKYLTGNDDSGTRPDARFEYDVPADGDYFILLHDHRRRGAPEFVYRVEVAERSSFLRLTIPRFGQDSQARQSVAVPRGGRMATMLNVQRGNFAGDVAIQAQALPQGITLDAPPIPAAMGGAPMLFTAGADAELTGGLVSLRGECEAASVRGGFAQNLELVIGPPNRTVFYSTSVNRLAVAVVEEAPYDVRIETPKTPLVRGGAMQLQVVAERAEGFTAPIVVRLLGAPPGMGFAATVTIPENADRVALPINAAGNAALGIWPLVVLGEANTDAGPMLLASDWVKVEIAPPFLQLQLEMAAVEQGKSGSLIAKVEQLRPFEGKARAVVGGLPAKTRAGEAELDATTEELLFEISAEADGPVGKHKGLFCRVLVPFNGDWIRHDLARGSVLRVDPPPKEPVVAAPKPAATEAKPAAAKEKPLPRLEQLRRAAQHREREGQAEGASSGGEGDRR